MARNIFSKHQFATTPSKGFVWSKVRKYMGQRATFAIKDGVWLKLLYNEGFDRDKEVKANGIFWGLYKKELGRFQFVFRGVMFKQGDKTARPFRGHTKKMELLFWADEIGLDAASQLSSIRGLLTGGLAQSGGF